MNQLELKITRPYRDVCGFDSKNNLIQGLIKYVKLSLVFDIDIVVLMDIVIIDVFDA